MQWSVAIKKSAMSLWRSLPTIIGVIMLVGLVNALIPRKIYSLAFTGNSILDPLIGSGLGSILAGNPITSYIIAGELFKQGISIIAVTGFIVAWVTVGIVQLPAEISFLGKKFALARNLLSFIFSVIVAIVVYLILSVW